MEEARVVAWFVVGLRREAIRLAKKHKRLREHELLILNQRLRDDAAGEVVAEMIDTVAANANTFAEVEQNLFVEEMLSLLTPPQKKVIQATILDEVTEQELANEMGVSKQAVSRMRERALNRLRKYLVLDKPDRQVEPRQG
ncbi:DNA-directed RNA polymerase subunit sigma-24 [Clostridiales bacterium PH28_bin88]|nr:DNA-directed RNA polymerase subunit sigma-24 [Clostridiales bacterium PH28_bin88]